MFQAEMFSESFFGMTEVSCVPSDSFTTFTPVALPNTRLQRISVMPFPLCLPRRAKGPVKRLQLRPKKKIPEIPITEPKKLGSVGREKFFLGNFFY